MLSFQGHADIARLYGGGEGKGIILAFVKDLCHNEFYRWLTTVQRVHVSICLGSIDLDKPYYYNAGICSVNLMFLSWAEDSPKYEWAEMDIRSSPRSQCHRSWRFASNPTNTKPTFERGDETDHGNWLRAA